MGLRAWAPGRVNLIGDHTDYMGGLALPMAIGLGTEITGDRGGNWVMLGSDGFDGVAEIPLDGVPDPATVEPRVGPLRRRRRARGAARATGWSAWSHSTLPAGSGLASSAALEVAVATALGADRVNPFGRRPGVPAGRGGGGRRALRDHGPARVDRRGRGDRPCASTATPSPSRGCRSPRTRRSWSSTRASTASSRRRPTPNVGPSARPPRRSSGACATPPPSTSRHIDDPVLRRRARHVTTENERVDALTSALAQGQLAFAGELLVASHASMRDDFEVSTPALDELVGTVRGVPGVYGARVTGAGFGGCVIVLCRPKTRLEHAGRLAGPARRRGVAVHDLTAHALGRTSPSWAARRALALAVRAPHQNRSWPSTRTTGATPSNSGTCRSANGYGSLGASTTSGRRAPHLVERHGRVPVGGVGEHVGDADRGEQRRAVGAAGQRHPRPLPDRHEGPQPGRRRLPDRGVGRRHVLGRRRLGARQARQHPQGRRHVARSRRWTATPSARRPRPARRRPRGGSPPRT